jgi:hypothetical protein
MLWGVLANLQVNVLWSNSLPVLDIKFRSLTRIRSNVNTDVRNISFIPDVSIISTFPRDLNGTIPISVAFLRSNTARTCYIRWFVLNRLGSLHATEAGVFTKQAALYCSVGCKIFITVDVKVYTLTPSTTWRWVENYVPHSLYFQEHCLL